jgi:hypothetical protein
MTRNSTFFFFCLPFVKVKDVPYTSRAHISLGLFAHSDFVIRSHPNFVIRSHSDFVIRSHSDLRLTDSVLF